MKFVTKWKDEKGEYRSEELVLTGNSHSWKPRPPVPFGDVVRIVSLPKQESECVQDLQAGSLTCYSADSYKTDKGETIIYLVGNGWAEELGFPYSDEYGGYPLLAGKTAEKFMELAGKDMFGDWKDIYSGDINDLALVDVRLTANESPKKS